MALVYFLNAGFGIYTAIDIPAGGIAISKTLPVAPSFNSNKKKKDHGPGNGYAWSVSPCGSHYDRQPPMLAILLGAVPAAHISIINLRQDPSLRSYIGQNV
jgi:hypothetical protein